MELTEIMIRGVEAITRGLIDSKNSSFHLSLLVWILAWVCPCDPSATQHEPQSYQRCSKSFLFFGAKKKCRSLLEFSFVNLTMRSLQMIIKVSLLRTPKPRNKRRYWEPINSGDTYDEFRTRWQLCFNILPRRNLWAITTSFSRTLLVLFILLVRRNDESRHYLDG